MPLTELLANFQTFHNGVTTCFQSNSCEGKKSASAFSFHHPGSSNKIRKSVHPSGPWTTPRHPGNHHQQQISLSFHHQSAAPNQHQLPPPGSSTKSASASSLHHKATAANQHELPASSFHHQTAAPHQPASSKASNQSAVNSTTLPHPHHGSQVCCCLDILCLFLLLYFSLSYCTEIK